MDNWRKGFSLANSRFIFFFFFLSFNYVAQAADSICHLETVEMIVISPSGWFEAWVGVGWRRGISCHHVTLHFPLKMFSSYSKAFTFKRKDLLAVHTVCHHNLIGVNRFKARIWLWDGFGVVWMWTQGLLFRPCPLFYLSFSATRSLFSLTVTCTCSSHSSRAGAWSGWPFICQTRI